ncbi:phosphatase PAP2 family protein [Agrobacterium rubi]|uniref:Phosphatidic acid phosphatase type 2/haloperoxidase domain-containing protein n=1 Tax=Agrobacterium rubi TR3 = NBRC 13261 TaxID=1368415 RepID=A0A081CX86_9HYPH|nr:phosphatase PAP2 family protein [Agrobacterium rubi]MBP1879783.1 membrane-associated phospholipid phosphatase [Agrobacterium rubi]MCL6654404.1 phosphatidic acid phosphatase [Agrobacterium rubi]NTF08844.1 phosphatase PAP2 family protein [Agrobacterium rubi]NTF21072.1 phosphatase PAP2 family protein [Agrobacterium rubi]NTF27972.1 phosphatase PAP2 family protein [Agrobacterium rubi]
MRRFFVSSGWILAATFVLVLVFIPFDPVISQRAQALPGSVIGFNKAITDFGTFRWMLYSTGLLAIVAYTATRVLASYSYASRIKTAWRLLLYFFLTIGMASILVHVLKFLIGRARPELLMDMGAYSLTPFTGDNLYESFPSGHSAAAGAFFGAFLMLIPRFRFVFIGLALVIGVSRVIVGAHYPSDVAAGLLLGTWTAMAFAFIFARSEWLFRLDANGWPHPKNAVSPAV